MSIASRLAEVLDALEAVGLECLVLGGEVSRIRLTVNKFNTPHGGTMGTE